MNIDRLNQNLASSAYGLRGKRTGQSGAAGDASAAGGTGSSAAPSADGVELSDGARMLSRAQTAARAAPDVREGLVQQLRAQVQSGQYVPNDEAVAARLVGGEAR